MGFVMITDARGDEYLMNSDCIAYVEPLQRGGWTNGGRVRLKAGIIDRPASIELTGKQARDLILLLTQYGVDGKWTPEAE